MHKEIKDVDLQKVMDHFYDYLDVYETANPDWFGAAILSFFRDMCNTLYSAQDWSGSSQSATRVSARTHLDVGKYDEETLYSLATIDKTKIWCKEQLGAELADLFFRVKLHSAMQHLSSPAVILQNGSRSTVMLSGELQKIWQRLSPKKRIASVKELTKPTFFSLTEWIDSNLNGEPQISAIVEVLPLVVSVDYSVAYYPVLLDACIPKTGKQARKQGLLGTNLQVLIEKLRNLIPEEQMPSLVNPGSKARKSGIARQLKLSEYSHSNDFKEWQLYPADGRIEQCRLTTRQAKILETVWTKYVPGTEGIHYDEILKAAGIEVTSKSRWYDQFRSRPVVLRSLLIGNGSGYFRPNVECEPTVAAEKYKPNTN